ncbi:MAG: hypothetical protein Q7U44_05090 [Desulfuromonadales bacterium]|nr:hypothetical protein [Desulfuromonadales bacterium]
MKMKFFAALAVFMILTLTGCGSDHNHPPPEYVTTSIFSDARFDGDIQLDFDTDTLNAIPDDNPSVLAGIDPLSVSLLNPFLPKFEYRAFLHFPLDGVNGVPGNAIIDSAFLEIFINNIDIQPPADTIPMRIDLLSFFPPVLVGPEFDLLPYVGTEPVQFLIFLADRGRSITIDVTELMKTAQRSQLADFQIRIMEEFGIVTPGLIEINETTRPPLLTVTYY